MPVLPKPGIYWRSERDDEGARSRLKAKRLQLKGAGPRVPDGILLDVDVHIRRAELVRKDKFFAILIGENRLVLGVSEKVRALACSHDGRRCFGVGDRCRSHFLLGIDFK